MEVIIETISCSEEDTMNFAIASAEFLEPGNIVELIGELGAGKTFFVKSFCKYHGINESSSPSFAIVNEYTGDIKIYHFDFYRLKKVRELLDIGFYDYINDDEAITFIEWGNMYEEILPRERFVINFNVLDDNTRRIKLYAV